MDDKRTYLVAGAGHQGLAMAAHFSLCGESVNLWNRTEAHISDIMASNEIDCNGIVSGRAHINKVSAGMEDVLTDTVFVTAPSTAHKDIAERLADIILPDTFVFLNPGRTFGAFEFLETLIKCGCKYIPTIVETQSIVYTCRRMGADSSHIYALKNNVKMASIGKKAGKTQILDRMPQCIRDHFCFAGSVLETSLGNIGMILHCAPVLLNAGWIESDKHDFYYYYDGISPSIGKLLEKMDLERVNVAKKLGVDTPSLIEWFREAYGVCGSSVYECIQNNESYRKIDAPRTLKHRYLDEDVPNGLVPVEYLGKSLGVDVSNISLVISLAETVRNGAKYRAKGRKYSKDDISRLLDMNRYHD